jgi:hypothetical protein
MDARSYPDWSIPAGRPSNLNIMFIRGINNTVNDFRNSNVNEVQFASTCLSRLGLSPLHTV